MSSSASHAGGVLARRSMLKTLRQPFQLFPIVFFPLILLAVNASGLKAATRLPGFPTHSYVSFAIAVAFIQGGMFALINTGTNLAEDIESGFFNRLALTPLRRVSLIARPARRRGRCSACCSRRSTSSMSLIAGAHLDAGFGGALVILALGALTAVAFGALGCAAALRTGSGRGRAGPLPAVLRVHLPVLEQPARATCCGTGWFHTVADWNPISYLIEGFRSLFIFGWDGTALWRGFAVAIGLTIVSLLAVAGALRTRLQRT